MRAGTDDDVSLLGRLRAALADTPGVAEKTMFGGVAFLVDGAMVVAANRAGQLMVRCDPDRAEDLLTGAGVARVVMRGSELAGWLVVDRDLLADEQVLRGWVETGCAGARIAGGTARRTGGTASTR